MAPSHLQGLNLVYPEPQHPPSFISDTDLLAIPNYPPELAAQLDLWTNLAFQADETPPRGDSGPASTGSADDEDDDDEASPGGPAQSSAHENVVTGTAVESAPPVPPAPAGEPVVPSASQFDLPAFLASMGMPPYVHFSNGAPPEGVNAPSLASILALYSTFSGGQPAPPPPAAAPAAASEPAAGPAAPRPAKRARTRKASVAPPPELDTPADTYADEFDDESFNADLSTSMTPVEDKRRRNTAASARFRAKKKEREAALEKKAKDLENRVGDLERECEALRRENGWLKGLVVGVTGAGASQAVTAPALPVGTKRRRDDA